MPIREYKCPQCGNVVEALVQSNDEPIVICVKHLDNKGFRMDQVEFSVPAKRNPRHGEM